MTLAEQARVLSEYVGWTVQVHPYDIGYARRIAGWKRPDATEQARGWDQADKELSQESKPTRLQER
jgi:hypothetical protein